jgi:prolipoprotein diacylglyceryltransferase
VSRFLVEFIRLNPVMLLGMTQAQIISIFYILTGVLGWILVETRARKTA